MDSPRLKAKLMAAAIAAGCTTCLAPAHAQDLSRLQSLLATTPEGGWVNVGVGSFNAAWPTGSTSAGTVYPTANGPGAIVYAWSGFAWDSNRGEILLWGGGHANYAGNEIYRWQADTGTWDRGSLPSKVISSNYVVDHAAPQAAHTYDGNIFLPVNDMFVSFGGPIYNNGEEWRTLVNGVATRAGPWMWDPTKADANKVGGTTGSGYDPATLGGNMWINRQGQWTGNQGTYSPHVTTAYRNEGGQDVVYLTMDSFNSQFPGLYRYTLGDIRNGGLDNWQRIGVTANSNAAQGVLTLDSVSNLLVRTATNGTLGDLAVWKLANSNSTNPTLNKDTPVHLVTSTGTPFVMTQNHAIEFDDANNQYILWDGSAQGKVWSTRAVFNPNGTIASTWVVTELPSTTTAQPSGNFATGVLGKLKYVPELDAFIALNEFGTNQDAQVWLYKPFSSAVPEPHVGVLMLVGAGFLLWRRRSRTLH